MTLPTCHSEQCLPVASVGWSCLPSTCQQAIGLSSCPVSVTPYSSVFIDNTDILVNWTWVFFPSFKWLWAAPASHCVGMCPGCVQGWLNWPPFGFSLLWWSVAERRPQKDHSGCSSMSSRPVLSQGASVLMQRPNRHAGGKGKHSRSHPGPLSRGRILILSASVMPV